MKNIVTFLIFWTVTITNSAFVRGPYSPFKTHHEYSDHLPQNVNSKSVSGKLCTCVPAELCNDGKINRNGMGIFSIRSFKSQCKSAFEVCCESPMDEQFPANNLEKNDPQITKNCGYSNPIKDSQETSFGISSDDRNSKAKLGEYPWIVAIHRSQTINSTKYRSPKQFNIYQCGGTLIHPQMVVTAAHCINKKNRNGYRIRAGVYDTKQLHTQYPVQDREVLKIEIHPQFYAGALQNDIALLYLDKPVQIAENVNTICLPEQDLIVEQTSCYVSGWGKQAKRGRYQAIPKKINVPMVPRDACEASLQNTPLGQYFELHRSFICAGGDSGNDACDGDGGSPLMCPIGPPESKRFFLAGIVAWGIGCGETDTPGVYVNLGLFREWIDEKMLEYNLDTNSYSYSEYGVEQYH